MLFPNSDSRSSTPSDRRCALFDPRQTFAEFREAAFDSDETNLDAVETTGQVSAKVVDPFIEVIDPLTNYIHGAPVHPCRDKDRQHDGERDLDELTV
jgi:hypothetical protein